MSPSDRQTKICLLVLNAPLLQGAAGRLLDEGSQGLLLLLCIAAGLVIHSLRMFCCYF